MVNCGILQTQREGGWGWGQLKWLCWHCPLLPSWVGEGQGCDPHHPQRVQRAGMDSGWLELSASELLHFRGYVGIHPPTMGMYTWTAFFPESWLLVILILVCFSQMSHRQRVLRELFFHAWAESVLPHDFTVLCCLAKKGRMLFHMEHFIVEQNPAWGELCNLNVLWQLHCVYPKL